MDVMEIARYNIKRSRNIRGLRQQDLADKLNLNLRSYQNLESGATRMDLERLVQIAEALEVSPEDLLKQEGMIIHQEVGENSGEGPGNVYNNGIEKEVLDQLLAAKDGEIQSLKEELKYLKEKVDQFMEMLGKK